MSFLIFVFQTGKNVLAISLKTCFVHLLPTILLLSYTNSYFDTLGFHQKFILQNVTDDYNILRKVHENTVYMPPKQQARELMRALDADLCRRHKIKSR